MRRLQVRLYQTIEKKFDIISPHGAPTPNTGGNKGGGKGIPMHRSCKTGAPKCGRKNKIAGSLSASPVLQVRSTPGNGHVKITIVTPNFNQGAFLETCIRSVLSQGYPNLEYMVIDGGSSDHSVDIIRKYEDRLSYWVSEKDDGQSDAINKGLNRATGRIFNWLNADDFLEPGALWEVERAYGKAPAAAGWVGGCRRLGTDGTVLNVIYPNGLDLENIGQNWNGRQFYQPSCFLSREKVADLGGIDPGLHIAMDLDLWIRLLRAGTFTMGRGIWSNAVIHEDAKTQKLRKKVLLETSAVQRQYGFSTGSRIRKRVAMDRGRFQFVPPGTDTGGKKPPPDISFRYRRHMCVPADLSSPRDREAIRDFADTVFADISCKHPGIELHIITLNTGGNHYTPPVSAPRVRTIRTGGDWHGLLSHYKLMAIPPGLETGATTALAPAMSAGLPLVAHQDRLRGWRDGRDCFLARTPEEFTAKTLQLLDDAMTWQYFSHSVHAPGRITDQRRNSQEVIS